MALKPSKLRRLNQRVTLAKHKFGSAVGKPFLSLLVMETARGALETYARLLINKRNRPYFYFFSTPVPASEIILLNRMHVCFILLGYLETGLGGLVVIRIFKVIFDSYSNNKY